MTDNDTCGKHSLTQRVVESLVVYWKLIEQCVSPTHQLKKKKKKNGIGGRLVPGSEGKTGNEPRRGRGGQDLKFCCGPTEREVSLRTLRGDVKNAVGFVPQIKD